MKCSIFIILGLVVASFGYRSSSSRKQKVALTKLSVFEIQSLATTIVENENLNAIFSEVIGLNITTLDLELKGIFEKLVVLKSARDEKIKEILDKTSINFRLNVGVLAQKFRWRLLTLTRGLTIDNNSLIVNQAWSVFTRRLANLVKNPERVRKQDVVRVFEGFLNTKLTSTLREEVDVAKVLLGTYFLITEVNQEFFALALQEAPTVEAELRSLSSEMQLESVEMLRPLLDLLKPIVVPKYEAEFVLYPTANSIDKEEDNEID